MTSSSRDVLSRLDPRVPDRVLARLLDRQPSPAADVVAAAQSSATVILVHDHPLQTYLLHRHDRMPFAAGMVVFPGGRVDPDDHRAGDHDDDQVRRRCAVRELVEETGVRVDPAALLPWAHWITPEHEPRRFDTTFYLAVMPDDQQAQNISGEADRAHWARPVEALWAADRGELALMPPTRSVLLELADHDSVAAVLTAAADRRVETVLPRLVEHGDGWAFDYSGEES